MTQRVSLLLFSIAVLLLTFLRTANCQQLSPSSVTKTVVGHDDHDEGGSHHDHDHEEEHESAEHVTEWKIVSIIVIPAASVAVVLFVIFAPSMCKGNKGDDGTTTTTSTTGPHRLLLCCGGSEIMSLASSLSAGLFFVMGMCHMLAEANEVLAAEFSNADKFQPAFISATAGYFLLVMLERGVFGGNSGHQHMHHPDGDGDSSSPHDGEVAPQPSPPAPKDNPLQSENELVVVVAAYAPTPGGPADPTPHAAPKPQEHALVAATLIALGVHSIFVGMSLGLQDTDEGVFLLLATVLAHQWAEDFALAVETGKAGYSTARRLLVSFCESSSCALGIAIGWAARENVPASVSALLTAAAAGTLINLACTHIIPSEMPMEKRSFGRIVAAVVGAGAMYAAIVLLHGAHSHSHSHDH